MLECGERTGISMEMDALLLIVNTIFELLCRIRGSWWFEGVRGQNKRGRAGITLDLATFFFSPKDVEQKILKVIET